MSHTPGQAAYEKNLEFSGFEDAKRGIRSLVWRELPTKFKEQWETIAQAAIEAQGVSGVVMTAEDREIGTLADMLCATASKELRVKYLSEASEKVRRDSYNQGFDAGCKTPAEPEG